ncbi:MAG: DUF4093 domain-containing protein [Clostridia bacterium]|nr:DUF4093 domain-containing protein [Clostridia bacterium]
MYKIKEVIVVEGKYDKIKLSQIFDTSIICVDGFRIYNNEDIIKFLKKLSDTSGVIIFTDSDSAGFRIRNYIKNKLSGCNIKHAFIPDVYGKESRKEKPSKEGKLGVEGISNDIIIDSVKKCGATFLDDVKSDKNEDICLFKKFDLYSLGLYGQQNSKTLRDELLKELSLPSHMSSNMLLDVLNTMLKNKMITIEELLKKSSLIK